MNWRICELKLSLLNIQYCPGISIVTEENLKLPHQDNQYPGRDMKPLTFIIRKSSTNHSVVTLGDTVQSGMWLSAFRGT